MGFKDALRILLTDEAPSVAPLAQSDQDAALEAAQFFAAAQPSAQIVNRPVVRGSSMFCAIAEAAGGGAGFFPLSGGGYVLTATEANVDYVAPTTCTLKSIYGKNLAAMAAGAATVTLRVNGADSALTITWLATDAIYTAHELVADVSINKGDRLNFNKTGVGAARLSVGIRLEI